MLRIIYHTIYISSLCTDVNKPKNSDVHSFNYGNELNFMEKLNSFNDGEDAFVWYFFGITLIYKQKSERNESEKQATERLHLPCLGFSSKHLWTSQTLHPGYSFLVSCGHKCISNQNVDSCFCF